MTRLQDNLSATVSAEEKTITEGARRIYDGV